MISNFGAGSMRTLIYHIILMLLFFIFLQVHLYDLRSEHKVKTYSKASIFFGATSVDFSKGGQIMFVGYEDYTLRAWDVLRVSKQSLSCVLGPCDQSWEEVG